MTYHATRYARTPGTAHPCPNASDFAPHDLIQDPTVEPNAGTYVCPYAFDAERSAAYRDQQAAEAASERQGHAERIADRIIRDYGRAGENIDYRDALERAALQALTESEEA